LANISEGYERPHRKEYIRLLGIAKGSAGEVEAYLMLARDLGYITDNYLALEAQRKEVAMVLIGLIGSLRVQ
jgi:four helix bundle protein